MPRTRNLRVTIWERIECGPTFRKTLIKDGVNCLLAGDVEVGKSVLRNTVNASVGFRKVGKITHNSPKILMRMLGPNGNLQARNLVEISRCLQDYEGLHLRVQAVR